MKKLLFVLTLFIFRVHAQQKVFFISDSKNLDENLTALYQNHELVTAEETLKSNSIILEMDRFSQEMRRITYKQGIKFSDFGFSYSGNIDLFVDINGKIEAAIYSFSDYKVINGSIKEIKIEDVPIDLKQKTESVLNEIIATYKVKSLAMRPFLLKYFYSFAKPKREAYSAITVEQALAITEPDTVKSINFSSLRLTQVPNVIYRFKNLTELILKDNDLESIPVEIFQLKKLRMLDVSRNFIGNTGLHFTKNRHLTTLNLQANTFSTLPHKLAKNKRLENLLLGNNQLDSLTNAPFKKLKRLKNLNLYNAYLQHFPNEIVRLNRLEELDLYHNELRYLPDNIVKLKRLKTLAVSNNALWKLPEHLKQLSSLKTLYAHHNKLSTLPVLPNLKLIDIANNRFNSLPISILASQVDLEVFDCSNNMIVDLPKILLQLPHLKEAYIKGNPYSLTEEKEAEFEEFIDTLEKKGILIN